MSRRAMPDQETYIMRHYRAAGMAFDPDKVCPYTGRPLVMFPAGTYAGHPGFWRWLVTPGQWEAREPEWMGFWRNDGKLCAVVPMTPQEKAWILSNPGVFAESAKQFHAWLTAIPK